MRMKGSWRMLCRTLSVALVGLACTTADAQTIVPAGAGRYCASTPAGQDVPSNNANAPVSPKTAPGFVGPPPTNKLSSSHRSAPA